MKNLLFVFLTTVAFSVNLHAQDYSRSTQDFGKGQTIIELGYGVLPTNSVLENAGTKLPVLSLRADRFMGEKFSLGVSYTVSSQQGAPIIVGDGFSQRVTNTTHQVALRPTFHYTKAAKADLYGGINLGVNLEKYDVDFGDFSYIHEHLGIQPQRTKMVYSAFVGGKYALGNHLSAFGEVGFGASLVTLGVGYRL